MGRVANRSIWSGGLSLVVGWLVVAVVLWHLDLLFHLDYLGRAITGPRSQQGLADFVGLFLGDLKAAAAITAAGCLAASIVALARRVRGHAPRFRQAIVTLGCAALCGIAIVMGLRLALGFSSLVRSRALVVGLLLTMALWMVVSRLVPRDLSSRRLAALIVISFPALTLASLLRSLGTLSSEGLGWRTLTYAGVAALLAFAVRRAASVSRRSAWGTLIFPPLLALTALVTVSEAHASFDLPRDTARRGARMDDMPPDILLVVLDTVRADRIQIYGHDRVTMPHLGQWAEDATVFHRAVANGGWTAASHASIFSGLSVSEHGVHFSGRPGALQTPPREGLAWLPEEMRRRGYSSLAFSANPVAVTGGVEGFDLVVSPSRNSWSGGNVGALADRAMPGLRGVSAALRWRMPYFDAATMVDLVTSMPAEDDRGPLFLFVNLMDAHPPYNPPQDSLRALGMGDFDPPFDRYSLHRPRRPELLAGTSSADLGVLYDGELHSMDEQLSRLLAWAGESLRPGATLIVTSDHGEDLGEEGRIGHVFGLTQHIIHVPLIIRSPSLESGIAEMPVELRDLYAFVLAESSGASAQARQALGGRAQVISERYPSYTNSAQLGPDYYRPWIAIIRGDLKGVGPSSEGFELFDLDPLFAQQRASSSATSDGSLAAAIDAFWDQRDSRDDVENLSPEDVDRLRSLGYLN